MIILYQNYFYSKTFDGILMKIDLRLSFHFRETLQPKNVLSFQPMFYKLCNKGHSMYYPVSDGARKISRSANEIVSIRNEMYLCGESAHSWCDGSSDRFFMVDPLSYFSFQPVLHDWCNKCHGMCYPVCRMMYIK